MAVVRVGALPEAAVEASARFHAEVLPRLPRDEDLVLVFEPAAYDHRGWRLALVQDLARAAAPLRVNAVVGGGGDQAIAKAVAWLEQAPGVTGQLLAVAQDDSSAER
jgi:hypothetical protein